MPTSATEFQAKVDKTGVNMDRFDGYINGDENTDVVTDSGTVPSIAKVQKANKLVVGQAEADANRAELAASDAEEIRDALAGRLTSIIPISLPGYAFGIANSDGSVVLGIKNDGTAILGALEISGVRFGASALPGYQISIADLAGNVVLGLRNDGVLVGTIAGATAAPSTFISANNFPATIVGYFSYGQSLSAGVKAVPSISLTQRFDNITFNGGVRTLTENNARAARTAFKPLVENDVANVYGFGGPGSGGPAGETPCSGAGDALKELIASENRLTYQQHSFKMLAAAPGYGGITVGDLRKGSAFYQYFMDDVQAATTVAAAAGETFKLLGYELLQGENPTGVATWAQTCVALRGEIDADVKAITGQKEDVLCFLYQSANEDVAIQQRLATKLDNRIVGVEPIFYMPKVDGVHFTARSSKWWGCHAGRIFKRRIVDLLPASWMEPVSTFRQGKIVEIEFSNVTGTLRFNTSDFPQRPNYGFHLFTADGGTELTITSVTVIQPNRIRVTCLTPIPQGAKLRYGMTNPAAHGEVANDIGGNLCDSDPTIIDPNGGAFPLNRWCIIFEETL